MVTSMFYKDHSLWLLCEMGLEGEDLTSRRPVWKLLPLPRWKMVTWAKVVAVEIVNMLQTPQGSKSHSVVTGHQPIWGLIRKQKNQLKHPPKAMTMISISFKYRSFFFHLALFLMHFLHYNTFKAGPENAGLIRDPLSRRSILGLESIVFLNLLQQSDVLSWTS